MKSKVNMLGRTMWETIAAMSVIGLISIGIIKMASTVMERYRLSRIGQQVTDLQKAINFRYMSKGRYNNLNFDQMIAEGAIPYEVKNKVNAFGGAITIGGIVINNESERYDESNEAKDLYVARRYYIRFEGLPLEACTNLADISWINDGSSSLVATYLGKDCAFGDVSNKQPNDKYAPNTNNTNCFVSYSTPIEVDVAGNGCSEKNSSIIWIFE